MTYKALSFEEIKKEAKEIHWMLVPIFEEFEEIVINNKKALKNTWESKTKGPMIAIYIPTDNKVYTFTLAWAPDEKERCIQEFESFLETISID
jgi:CRISPR/Cas system CSM-associated protein Csm4 (group 5 of RAMP superfamily)